MMSTLGLFTSDLFGMVETADRAIWAYARQFVFLVTTKDKDYLEILDDEGWPPKLMLVRIRNAPNDIIAYALRRQFQDLLAFSRDSTRGLYELY